MEVDEKVDSFLMEIYLKQFVKLVVCVKSYVLDLHLSLLY